MQNNNDLENKNFSTALLVVSELLKKYGINSANFAKLIGKNPTYVNDIKKGKTKRISEEVADKIINLWPEVSKIWLLTGEGEMLLKDNASPKPYDGGDRGGMKMAAEELAAYGVQNISELKRENTMLYNYIKLLTEKAAMLESELQNEREKANSLLARMNEATISQ